MITRKQIEKLALSKLEDAKLYESPSDRGWHFVLYSRQAYLETHAPTRAAARAGLNAMLFALPKRKRAAR